MGRMDCKHWHGNINDDHTHRAFEYLEEEEITGFKYSTELAEPPDISFYSIILWSSNPKSQPFHTSDTFKHKSLNTLFFFHTESNNIISKKLPSAYATDQNLVWKSSNHILKLTSEYYSRNLSPEGKTKW